MDTPRRHGLAAALLGLLAGTATEALADPYRCGEADLVTVANATLAGMDYLSCRARLELTLGPDLALDPDARMDVGAPALRLVPPFSVAQGAGFSATYPPCGALLTFEAGQHPSQEIHVDVAGSNSPGCGTPGTPCATIEHAAGLASPGTAIRVHPGIHAADQFIANLTGTAQAPIWIGGVPGQAVPVIDGGSQGLHLVKPRYVIVHDLVVRNSTANGINTDDGGETGNVEAARYLVFRNLLVHDIGTGGNQDCLKLSGIDDFWVYDSEFHHCGGGGSAVDMVGCHDGVIQGNYLHDLGSSGIQCKGGSKDVEIHANLFEDAGDRAINMGGSTGEPFFRPPLNENILNAEARNVRAVGNVFIGGEAAIAFTGCVDCLAANNTIDTPTRWAFRILQETVSIGIYDFAPAGEGRVYNNIIYFDGQLSSAFNIGPDTAPGTFTLQANLWYRHDSPGQSSPPGGTPVADPAQLTGQDPDFADPGTGDYHIDNTSPAWQSGTDQQDIHADFDFACFGLPPSRGAFEVD